MLNLQTVESKRLYRQIAEQIEGLIESGKWAPGTKLAAERDLALQLGVSRPSVREALIALEVKGLVEIRMGAGVYVAEAKKLHTQSDDGAIHLAEEAPTWGPMELLAARGAIEGEIAYFAAIRRTSQQLEEIRSALSAMEEALETQVGLANADAQFHKSISAATGNCVFEDVVFAFWSARISPLFEQLASHFEDINSWRLAYREHEEIYLAIARQDGLAARSAMHFHLDSAIRRLSASFAVPSNSTKGFDTSGMIGLD